MEFLKSVIASIRVLGKWIPYCTCSVMLAPHIALCEPITAQTCLNLLTSEHITLATLVKCASPSYSFCLNNCKSHKQRYLQCSWGLEPSVPILCDPAGQLCDSVLIPGHSDSTLLKSPPLPPNCFYTFSVSSCLVVSWPLDIDESQLCGNMSPVSRVASWLRLVGKQC